MHPIPLLYLFDRQAFALVTDNHSAGAGAPVAQGRFDEASVSFTFNRASGFFTATAALTQFDADRVVAHLNGDQVPVRPARRGGPDGSAARGGSSRAPPLFGLCGLAARGHERDPPRPSPSVRGGVYENGSFSDDSLEEIVGAAAMRSIQARNASDAGGARPPAAARPAAARPATARPVVPMAAPRPSARSGNRLADHMDASAMGRLQLALFQHMNTPAVTSITGGSASMALCLEWAKSITGSGERNPLQEAANRRGWSLNHELAARPARGLHEHSQATLLQGLC